MDDGLVDEQAAGQLTARQLLDLARGQPFRLECSPGPVRASDPVGPVRRQDREVAAHRDRAIEQRDGVPGSQCRRIDDR